MRIIVVGAGVIGLTCAVRLAEAGHEVDVLARDLPLETTSSVAAALWYPYRAAPPDRVIGWARRSFEVLAELADSEPPAAVTMRDGTELLRAPAGDPWWHDAVPAAVGAVRHPRAVALPGGYADGWRLRVPVVDMAAHLPWLVGRLERLGGTLTRAWLPALPAATVVVHCSGLAARALAGDTELTPVRGQVVLVEQPGLSTWLLDQSDVRRPVYVVPRASTVVVGGTADVGDFDLRPDPATAAQIIDRAAVLVPELRDARVLGHRVGLRPARPGVRLETERDAHGRTVVHCYGHGGAGVTLAWGCAEEVVERVAAARLAAS